MSPRFSQSVLSGLAAPLSLALCLGCSDAGESAAQAPEPERAGFSGAAAPVALAAEGQQRLRAIQLAALLPPRLGAFELYEPFGDFRDVAQLDSASARVLYYHGPDRHISLRITDWADSPEYADFTRSQMEEGGRADVRNPQTRDENGVFLVTAERDGGIGHLEALVGQRFHVVLEPNADTDRETLLALWTASGLADTLRDPAPGPVEGPAWARNASDSAYPQPGDIPEPRGGASDASGVSGRTLAAADVPACTELLDASELQAVCGMGGALSPAPAVAGQLCSLQGEGLVFLLTRLADGSEARRAADVALGGYGSSDTAVLDSDVNGRAWPTGGHVAVAAVGNVLVELRSLGQVPEPPPCTAEEVVELAGGVVSKLNALR